MRVAAVSICILNSAVLAQLPDFESPHHPSRLLVRFKPGANQAARQSTHDDAGALKVLEEYNAFEGLQLVEVPEGSVAHTMMAYLNDPNILSAEPDYERYPVTECNSNDPYLQTDLWGIKKVRAPEAWCVTTGDEDFRVAVIDSGIGGYDHPDLAANLWTNPLECPGGIGAYA